MELPRRNVLRLLAAAVSIAAALTACGKHGGDIGPDVPPIQPDLPPALTPDQAVSNLEWAWEHRDLQVYDGVLDEGFVFYFSQTDVDQLGVDPTWDRATEMANATKLFTAQPGTTHDGQVLPPVASFNLVLTPESPAWDDNVPAQFAGTLRRAYAVYMVVTLMNGDAMPIRGIQEFYVVPVQVDGATLYKLRAWVDYGIPQLAAGVGTVSLGSLKAMFGS